MPGDVDSVIVVEPAGLIRHHSSDPDAHSEDLYGLFTAWGELMGWSAAGRASFARRTWEMHEAQLASDRRDPLCTLQVGLAPGAALVPVIMPLVRCLGDALGRLGAVQLDGLWLTGSDLDLGQATGSLIGGLSWFQVPQPSATAQATITITAQADPPDLERSVLGRLQQLNTSPFGFQAASGGGGRDDASRAASGATVVSIGADLPVWGFDSVGWTVAIVADALSTTAAAKSFTVGVVRD